MASQVVQMDYPVIMSVSRQFKVVSNTLVQIGRALEVTITVLRAVAFCGNVLMPAFEAYLSVIKAKVDRLAQLTNDVSVGLARAVEDHRTGQYVAGSYFGEGLRQTRR